MKLKIFLLLTIVVMTACSHSPIDMAGMKTILPEEGIVIGRVKLLDRGEEQNLSFLGESKFRLFVLPENSSNALYVHLKDDGSFSWHLPAGRFSIVGFEWLKHGTMSGRIFATFDVSKNKATYIGTLIISSTGAVYSLAVADDYASRAASFKESRPDMGTGLEKHLMHLEERR